MGLAYPCALAGKFTDAGQHASGAFGFAGDFVGGADQRGRVQLAIGLTALQAARVIADGGQRLVQLMRQCASLLTRRRPRRPVVPYSSVGRSR